MRKSAATLYAALPAFVLCLILSAASVNAQQTSEETPRKLPPMPNSEETRCLTVKDCDRLIQALIVEYWKETKISQKAEKQVAEVTRERDELRTDRDKWLQLYTAEKEINSKVALNRLSLTADTINFKSENELNLRIIEAQNKKIRRLRLNNFIYSGLSFGAGFGIGYAVGNRTSNGVRMSF